MKRLLSYLKPHKWSMLLASFLVIGLISVELYKPIIIGNAIDNYITDSGQIPLAQAYEGIFHAGILYALMHGPCWGWWTAPPWTGWPPAPPRWRRRFSCPSPT